MTVSFIDTESSPEPVNMIRGEMALWKAVITQALMDAGSESTKAEAVQEKKKAIRWLLGHSDDFITVCLNAGLEPGYVRQKALAALERGCVWREGMAEKRMKTDSLSRKAAILHFQKKRPGPSLPVQRPKPCPPFLVADFCFSSPRLSRPFLSSSPR